MAEKAPEGSKTSPTKSKKKTGRKKATSKSPAPEAKQASPAQPPSQSSPVSATTEPVPAPRGKSDTLALAALGVSFIALIAGGFAWYQSAVDARLQSGQHVNRTDALEQRLENVKLGQEDVGQKVATVVEDLGARIETLRSEMQAQQGAVEARVAESAASLDARSEAYREEFQALSDSIRALEGQLGRSVESWSLAEVEQLMVIANHRLHLSGDSVLAGDALRLADSRLKQLSNPALLPVREQLAGEIAALSGVEQVDTVGAVFALAALSETVGDLPLAGDPDEASSDASEATAETSAAGDSSWASASRELLSDLGALVQIEKDGVPATPVLSAEIRLAIAEKTRLMLEAAQLAFLRGNGALYAERMAAIESWASAKYDASDAAVAAWLEQLSTLAGVSPEVDLPDISGSLEALREVMKQGA